MTSTTNNYGRGEQLIGALLWYGTWLASAVIAFGIGLNALEMSEGVFGLGFGGTDIVKVGVALFILLPISRVALMLVIFLYERDYVFVAIAALVLATIAVAIVIGI